MKWLCEVRLGPIYSETQGSPHSVDDESFSNKVSRNSSPSLISYHLTAAISIFVRYPQAQGNIQENCHLLMIFNTKVPMSLISPFGSGVGRVTCDPSIAGSSHPTFSFGAFMILSYSKVIGVLALSWQYYMWPV